MRKSIVMLMACALGGTAHAADKPVIGPPGAWVKPAPRPPLGGKPDGAALKILLQDQQIDFEAGQQTTYSETIARIQTPQGLGAGSIAFAWNPATETPTVHKLQILRGDQVIDVLASGQTFTVLRRESNLENAALDGMLTATLQPEGLQAGDVIDFAISMARVDPVLKGHVEQVAAGWNGFPIAHARLRAQWPSTLPITLRPSDDIAPPRIVKSGGMSTIELSFDDLLPIVVPKGAPMRFSFARIVEMSDFRYWADVAALLSPLYEKTSVLPVDGPLHAELERIQALSPDPKLRAQAALALVQDRVRYVALNMGEGGLVPADAAVTWSRRFGDCKGKTVLLLALLHAMGIEAEPVAVNSVLGDGLDQRLPMIGLFNHVLVRATIAGAAYWLDGTRLGDRDLDAIKVPAFGWGLPLRAEGSALLRLVPPPLDQPTVSTSIRIDATAGLAVPAPIHVETVMRGDGALALKLRLADLDPDARDRALRDYWKGEYDLVDVKNVSAVFDEKTGEQRLLMDGDARMSWKDGYYQTDGTGVGYKADFAREPGPHRDAPFAVGYPQYSRIAETILLPAGGTGFTIYGDPEVDQTVAGIAYRRHAAIKGNVFTIEKSERSLVPEFPAADAPAAQTALRALNDRTVYLQKPDAYRQTDKEVTAAMAETPTTADSYVDRGNMLLDRYRFDEAITDFTSAIALDSKNATALADRGLAYVWKNNAALARKDLDAAAAIAPRNAVVWRARGKLALDAGVFADAITAFTTAIDIDPANEFAIGNRALAYRGADDMPHALADAAAAIKLSPKWTELYLVRANAFHRLKQDDDAIGEANALIAANPDDVYAQVVAARIYAKCHRQAEATKAFDRALQIKPYPFIYLNRSNTRPKTDFAGRQADADAAVKLDPKSSESLEIKARLQEDRGAYADAANTWSAAVAIDTTNPYSLTNRGVDYARSGQTALAEKDFAAARTIAETAQMLNAICYMRAMAGVALEGALTDCNAAVAKQPDMAGFLESRGLVLLRLGRFEQAIVDYDRALSLRPAFAAALFGRAVAEARTGRKDRSTSDVKAALDVDPDVREDFDGYGVRLEDVQPASATGAAGHSPGAPAFRSDSPERGHHLLLVIPVRVGYPARNRRAAS